MGSEIGKYFLQEQQNSLDGKKHFEDFMTYFNDEMRKQFQQRGVTGKKVWLVMDQWEDMV